MSRYYFDGEGKAMRPALTLIMARACNSHLKVRPTDTNINVPLHSQRWLYPTLAGQHWHTSLRPAEENCHHLWDVSHQFSAPRWRDRSRGDEERETVCKHQVGILVKHTRRSLHPEYQHQASRPDQQPGSYRINDPDPIRSCQRGISADDIKVFIGGDFPKMLMRYFRTDKDDRFQLYLDKTFNKTASLMANSCKSVAILANHEDKDNQIVVSRTKS